MPNLGEKIQYCPQGHNTFVTGRNKDTGCKMCRKRNMKDRNKEYYQANKDTLLLKKKQYYITHKAQIIKYKNEYELLKSSTDMTFKLTKRLRNRLYLALKGNYKSGSAVKDLGCSIEFLKQYLEDRFVSGMTWDNYGSYWEIDHIIPLHQFDLGKRKQFKKAVHYTNLQPLTILDHRKKSAIEASQRRNSQ